MANTNFEKGTFIAVRRLRDKNGETIAFVPAECKYLGYMEGSKEPHRVAFFWTYKDGRCPPDKYAKEHSSNVLPSDQKNFETILNICNKKNYHFKQIETSSITSDEERTIAFRKLTHQVNEAYKYASRYLPQRYLENNEEY